MEGRFYTPHLLVKRAEMGAIRDILHDPFYGISPSNSQPNNTLWASRNPLIPLFEIPLYFRKQTEKNFINAHAKLLHRNWNPNYPAFIDSFSCTQKTQNNTPIPDLVNKLWSSDWLQNDKKFVPVLHSFVQRGTEYAQIKEILDRKQASTVAMRLNLSQFRQWDKILIDKEETSNWLKTIGATEPYFVILDLGQVVDYSTDNLSVNKEAYLAARNLIQAIKDAGILTQIILLSTSVPESKHIHHGLEKRTREERIEWEANRNASYKNVAFGDYGTIGIPEQYSIDSGINISAKFKYTSDTKLLTDRNKDLFRSISHDPKKSHPDALIRVMQEITNDHDFKGGKHCTVDCWMLEIANGTKTDYQSPEKWLKKSTTHHLFFVLDQLHSLNVV